MNTIKTVVSLSLLAAFNAHAGQVHDASAAIAVANKVMDGMEQTIIDESDNRGMSFLFDDKTQPGQVIVSGVSTLARQAGAAPGDVLKRVCTTPANLRHFGELVAVAGDAKVHMIVGNQMVKDKIPAAAVKTDDKQRVLLTQAMSFEGVGPDSKVSIPAGAVVSNVCVPVRTVAEVVQVVAPFDHRCMGNNVLVPGGFVPQEYWLERYSYGLPVHVTLPDWNPPQKVAAAAAVAANK